MTRIDVSVEVSGTTVDVGSADVRRHQGVDLTEFAYASSFLQGVPWEISPDLPLPAGVALSDGLPGALLDSSPDAWGRNLIIRQRAAAARDVGAIDGPPSEVDFLLGVDDFTRQGALRFSQDGGPFLADHADVPHRIELSRLMAAAHVVGTDHNDAAAVSELLAAGSGSLGGARPKASVLDADNLYIAKFTQPGDSWDVIRWEAVALDLAAQFGLVVPDYELVAVAGEPILILGRFDRSGERRIPYLSAQSLTQAPVGAVRDYLDIVDGITDHGSEVADDLRELWRRIALSVAINNIDDHLRNHGFLHRSGGWALSPLFDVNPDPRRLPRATGIAGARSFADSVEALNQSADYFGVDSDWANDQWSELASVVSGWRSAAERREIGAAGRELFAGVLDRIGGESS